MGDIDPKRAHDADPKKSHKVKKASHDEKKRDDKAQDQMMGTESKPSVHHKGKLAAASSNDLQATMSHSGKPEPIPEMQRSQTGGAPKSTKGSRPGTGSSPSERKKHHTLSDHAKDTSDWKQEPKDVNHEAARTATVASKILVDASRSRFKALMSKLSDEYEVLADALQKQKKTVSAEAGVSKPQVTIEHKQESKQPVVPTQVTKNHKQEVNSERRGGSVGSTTSESPHAEAEIVVIAPAQGKPKRNRQSVVSVVEEVTKRARKILLCPDTSRFLKRWDIVISIALIFVCICTPFLVCVVDIRESSFMLGPTAVEFWMLLVSHIVDVIFISDIILQFFVMYQVEDKAGVKFERNPAKIAKRYLKGSFTIDVISCLPLDLAAISTSPSFNLALRVCRLLKLARATRLSRLFNHLEARGDLSFATLAMLKFFLILFIIIHWLACLWCLALLLPADKINEYIRWTSSFDEDVQTKNSKKYLASLYFTAYTMTSVGYGDITPKNTYERVICVIMLLISGVTWAVVVGHVCSIVARAGEEEAEYHNRLDELNRVTRDRHLDKDLRNRILYFARNNRTAVRRDYHRQLVGRLSHGLQGEFFMQVSTEWISKVTMLSKIVEISRGESEGAGSCKQFIIDFCSRLQPIVVSKGEFFGRAHTLYIMIVGVVGREGRVLHSGATWGLDFMLADPTLQSPTTSCALVYTELTVMDRDTFYEVLDVAAREFPALVCIVRWYCSWLALQRWIISKRSLRRASLSNFTAAKEVFAGLELGQ